MKYIASFDIGTTNVKGVLVDEHAGIFFEKNVALSLIRNGDFIEQDPESWYGAVRQIAAAWFEVGIKPASIALLAFSGQMQDCIPIGENSSPLRPAILYSDGRAAAQSERLIADIGNETIHRLTANHMDGTLTFPKMMWLRDNEPDTFGRTLSFLISSKDYVIAKLTGKCATDPTSAATAGCMDIHKREWVADWFDRYGVDLGQMPPIVPADEVVGTVTARSAADTGFAEGTLVVCGIGDAGSATLGAGAREEGDVYAYIGTTGWVAAVSSGYMDVQSGAFNLSYVEDGRQIAIAPLANAGNAHQWAMSAFGAGGGGQPNDALAYRQFEQMLASTERGRHETLFLPYLNGERCPVLDADASGCFIGLKPSTTRAEMATAVLEGVAFAMREVLELMVVKGGGRMTLIGGGAKSAGWCQIIADVLQVELAVPEDSQFLPSLGAAALGFRHVGWGDSYETIARATRASQRAKTYTPNDALGDYYNRQFQKYKRFYPAVAPLFR
ncbi:xylulokinase [Cohnella soli]|uniref:FGGY-family carbohydrate kinase n=1 Tax=Cohnella soli TaxID=425005 RepID=A0ABW0HU08_9BACL